MARHILGVLGIAAVAVIALMAFAYRPALAPIAPPAAASFPPELVATGATLAGAGNCISCHTAPGGRANAGGKVIHTRVGRFYSPNLTPDPETGIGAWSVADLVNAFQTGFTPEFDSFGGSMAAVQRNLAHLSEEDLRAIAEYLKTLPPVKSARK